jgi:glycerophosphoryl diester phosphodiesterase
MRTFLIFRLCAVVLSITAYAQQTTMYLTNYSIVQNSDVIGDIKLTGDAKSITVSGEHGDAFSVNKKNQLVVSKKKLEAGWWFDVEIIAKTSSGSIVRSYRIIKDEFIRNKVIAHRGAWKNTGQTENSIGALEHAIKLGCEGSEFDVHMSADSLPVINHDPLIKEVSIAKSNASDLLTMRLSNGETLPTLENYLKAGMVQNKTKLILEIKPSELGSASSIALARRVVALVESMKAQAWVDYISFDYEVCKEVMRRAPYAKASYLKGEKTPAELAADHFYGLDYHYNVFQKNPGWIAEAKAKNLTVNVWTVNDRALMQELLKQGVDFITTNEPELLLTLVK